MWQRCRSHSGIRGEAGSRSVARVPKPQCGGGTELLQSGFSPLGGDDGDRTHDLRLAKPALYQLSYIPEISILPNERLRGTPTAVLPGAPAVDAQHLALDVRPVQGRLFKCNALIIGSREDRESDRPHW